MNIHPIMGLSFKKLTVIISSYKLYRSLNIHKKESLLIIRLKISIILKYTNFRHWLTIGKRSIHSYNLDLMSDLIFAVYKFRLKKISLFAVRINKSKQ